MNISLFLYNSAYGKTISNPMKHTDIKFGNKDKSQRFINEPFFKKATELGEDLYEIEMGKSHINWNLPNQVSIDM